jgi:hypothetical protein
MHCSANSGPISIYIRLLIEIGLHGPICLQACRTESWAGSTFQDSISHIKIFHAAEAQTMNLTRSPALLCACIDQSLGPHNPFIMSAVGEVSTPELRRSFLATSR